jgi:bifunctional non-homologous end joining protein LigD
MLATLIAEPFNSKDWIFEVKWDGFRAVAYKKNKKVELLSRNNKSFNTRFPEIVKALEKLPGSFVVDGELVILNQKGHPDFQKLQNWQNAKNSTPCYCIFDILSYNNKDLTHLTLLERKDILRRLLASVSSKFLKFSEYIEEKGIPFFKKIKKQGLEGIIAKKRDSAYVSTRSKNWFKIKTHLRQEVVIGGITQPQGSRKHFGSLLVGVYEKGKFVYVGHVGGGFNEALLKDVFRQMEKLITIKCPFEKAPQPNAPVTWVKPKLICEVSFAEWTEKGIMRQPIFKGMRDDKKAQEVEREN